MIMPSFSIATPTHNALDKLRRCVGSVRGQTGISLEHIIQDANSDDGTGHWLATQAAERTDLVYACETDAGMYDAINRAWAKASGEVLSWLNADEQYLPGTLHTVAAYFDRHPNADVLFGDYIVCDHAGSPIALRREIPFRRFYIVNGFLYAASCTLFFRRRLLDRGLLWFNDTLRYAADHDLLLRLAAGNVKIEHLPRYLALFSIDGTNLSAHPQAQVEAERVRRKHGGFKYSMLRQLAMAGRRIERLVRGGYARETVSYLFAKDEIPNYTVCEAHGVGGRYALTNASGR